MRADGQRFAASFDATTDTARIAVWDLRSGAVVWVTPNEPTVRHVTPVWSADGSLLYYAAGTDASGAPDLGIYRMRADGTGRPELIRRPDASSPGTRLIGLTPDGAGLVWSSVRPGGTVTVLDLQSGTERAFEDTVAASLEAWRTSRPRALVASGASGLQAPTTLTLWDDVSGAKRILLGPDLPGSPTGVYGADFDPTGTRIVVVAYSRIGEIEGSALNLIDLNGLNRTVIAGSEGAQQVLWFRAGIAFARRSATGGTDLMIIQPAGGVPVTLVSAAGSLGRIAFVSP
jgi:WD40 repeat protein